MSYTSLSNIKEQGNYSFYGIVYDASLPVKENIDDEKSDYLCVIKLLSPDQNFQIDENFNDNAIHVIVKSNSIDNMPHIKSIGSIIRINNGVYRPKKRRNVYLNLTNISKIKSGWIIFETKDGNHHALASSTPYFSFDDEDSKQISFLYEWLTDYSRSSFSFNYLKQVNLSQLNKDEDSDLLVIVCHKVYDKDNIIFFIMDKSDTSQLVCSKVYDYIKEGDVIRIRSFEITEL